MTVDERLEDRLRVELRSWADEAPRSAPVWTAPTPRRRELSAPSWLKTTVPVALVAAVIAAIFVIANTGTDEDAVTVASRPGAVIEDIPVGGAFGVRVVAEGAGAVFVASENDRRLYRIDGVTHDVRSGPPLAVADAVVASNGSVFAVLEGPPRIARLDPADLTVERVVELLGEPGPFSLAVVADRLWAPMEDGTVRTFDPQTLREGPTLTADIRSGFQDVGPDAAWRTDPAAGTVLRLDPQTGEVEATIPIGGQPDAVVVGTDAVWVADWEHGSVVHIDPARDEIVATITVGRRPHGLAAAGDRVWVTNFEDGTLTTIDSTTDEVLTTVPVGIRPGGLRLVDGVLWVAIHQEGLVRLVDPETLERASILPIDEEQVVVDIDGRSVFMRCMGTARAGEPTVVLDAARGQWSEHWLFVQYALQDRARVCAYDRAGLGRSDSPPEQQDAEQVTADLRRLLAEADLAGPYVLVGANDGGLFARYFAATHPDEVAGLVLVDATSPGWVDDVLPLVGADDRAALEESLDLPGFANRATFLQVAAAGPLGDLPLVVIESDPEASPASAEIAELWHHHQQGLLALSTTSRGVMADGAVTPATQSPAVVVDAVESLLEA